MITTHRWNGKNGKACVIQDDLDEIEKILEDECTVEDDNFRRLLIGLDKTEV